MTDSNDIKPDDVPPEVPESYDTEIGYLSASLAHDHKMLQHIYGMTPQDAFAWMQFSANIMSNLGWVYENEDDT